MTPYLEKRVLYPPMIDRVTSPNLGIVIVIPCHNESELLLTFFSLLKCEKPKVDVEVITIINDGENTSSDILERNQQTLNDALIWSEKHSSHRLRFHTIYKSGLPKKFAGVGLARKIGMDEAVYRFEKGGKTNGVIVCFDADSKCDKNYLVAIEDHFNNYPKTPACSIHYEHPVMGFEFDTEIYNAIIDYELHLRYYVEIQRYAGFPFAFQTIGSSMAVRSDAYQKQGGMNRRKAGEDFYFLHKFTHFEAFTELKTTKVIPSPRISDRVPFGTGKAVGEILEQKKALLTYNPKSFLDLQIFFQQIPNMYQDGWKKDLLPDSILSFLKTVSFEHKLQEIYDNASSEKAFIKRFYNWFDAFMVMKYVHFARDRFFDNIPVGQASKWLINILDAGNELETNLSYLQFFRTKDRN